MTDISTYEKARTQLSLIEKVGQLFMPAAFINDTEEEILELEKLIQEHYVGGLCFFHSRASAATNFEGKKKVVYNEDGFTTFKALIQRYQKAAKYPLLMAIDAEWGLAMRIENTPQYPYAVTLGAIQGNSNLIYEVGKRIAKDCKAAGIHWNLAPVVDLNNNPKNPVIGYRSFGEDKKKVTEKALAFIQGTQSEGILTSIKHFPGHGDTATDSHLALPLITKSKEELLKNELYPFQKLIDEGVDSVMVGHLCVPSLTEGKTISSSISKHIIKDLLRTEIGYSGVVISDALNMHAVSKDYTEKGALEWLAFDAGNDVLCFAEHIPEGIKTILEQASENQIEESFQRIWILKEKALPVEDPNLRSELKCDNQLLRNLAQESITLFKGSEKEIGEFSNLLFVGMENMHSFDNQFFSIIGKSKEIVFTPANNEAVDAKNILLALFPKQVKPTHNFGFSDKEITTINTLFRDKNVVLYLFGNPYVLHLFDIENVKTIVIAYQNCTNFQEVAAEHFLGQLAASGKLSIDLGT